MADFIQTFRQLDAHQRQRALALLPAELTPYEWRDLHAITSTRSFHTDIIGRLPVELVAHVFSYLDPAAPYRCQSVSRQWHHVLRSLDVLKAPLHSWYRGALPLQDADYASCAQTASRIQRFRTGIPVSVYKLQLNEDAACLYLFDDHLIWLPASLEGPPRSACILNLRTWQLRHLAGEARERLTYLSASDQIVMLATANNTCYVFEVHHNRPPKKFRLPARKFLEYVVCHGRMVACLAPYKTHTSVFIWNYDTQQGTSFDISYGSDFIYDLEAELAGQPNDPREMKHMASVIQPETETIHLFFVAGGAVRNDSGRNLLTFATYTFRGEYVSSSHPRPPGVDQILFCPGGGHFVPVDDSNTVFSVRLRVGVMTPDHDNPDNMLFDKCLLPFQLNMKTHELSISTGPGLPDFNLRVHLQNSFSWWKDTCYGFQPYADIITYMGTCDNTQAHVPLVSDPNYVNRIAGFEDRRPLLLNEKYVVRDVDECAYLACFDDDNNNRPTEDGPLFDIGELFVL